MKPDTRMRFAFKLDPHTGCIMEHYFGTQEQLLANPDSVALDSTPLDLVLRARNPPLDLDAFRRTRVVRYK